MVILCLCCCPGLVPPDNCNSFRTGPLDQVQANLVEIIKRDKGEADAPFFLTTNTKLDDLFSEFLHQLHHDPK